MLARLFKMCCWKNETHSWPGTNPFCLRHSVEKFHRSLLWSKARWVPLAFLAWSEQNNIRNAHSRAGLGNGSSILLFAKIGIYFLCAFLVLNIPPCSRFFRSLPRGECPKLKDDHCGEVLILVFSNI